jgi:isopenicillin N synthase-like dioxygenase
MHQVQSVSEKLMICFARGLGFPDNYFIEAHDISQKESQSVCRLLHYFETPQVQNPTGEVFHRAGAHADWDFVTLLFQKAVSTHIARSFQNVLIHIHRANQVSRFVQVGRCQHHSAMVTNGRR